MSTKKPEGLPGRIPGESNEPTRQDIRRDATGSIQSEQVVSTSGTAFTTNDITFTATATTVGGEVYQTSASFQVTGLGTNTATAVIRRNGNVLTSSANTGTFTLTTSNTFTNGTASPSVELVVTGLTGGTGTVGTANINREARNRAFA